MADDDMADDAYYSNRYRRSNYKNSVLEKMLTDRTEDLILVDVHGELIAESTEIDYGFNRYGSVASALAAELGYRL